MASGLAGIIITSFEPARSRRASGEVIITFKALSESSSVIVRIVERGMEGLVVERDYVRWRERVFRNGP